MAEHRPLTTPFNLKAKEELIKIVDQYQHRHFCEEVDFTQQIGGTGFFAESLNTDFKHGISGNDIAQREAAFGSNRKKEPPPVTYWQRLKDALEDFMLRILLVASIVSIIINEITEEHHRDIAWIDGFAIFVAVAVCSNVTAINEYQKDKQFKELNAVADAQKGVIIFRGGKEYKMHPNDVYVGDIIKIFEGMEVPADGFLLEGHEVTADESAMTGESDPMKKANLKECLERKEQIIGDNAKNTSDSHSVPSPIILSGTKILTGEGKFVVIVVGESSALGKISDLVSQESETTPLQQKLETVARDIGKFGLYSAIVTVLVLVIRFIITKTEVPFEDSDLGVLLDYVIIGITVVVVAIPEGLPLAVTLSLAYSVKKMLTQNNLVRRMPACETMGGANMICSDKTGTLTQNKMTLTKIWNMKAMDVKTYDDVLNVADYCPPHAQEVFLQAINCNSSASLRPLTGSKTEIAMLEFTDKCQKRYETYREQHLPDNYFKIPFSSARKRMSTILENVSNGKPTRRRMHLKGASEIVLDSCQYFYEWNTNTVVPITQELKAIMNKAIEDMADSALRTICIGYKEIDGTEDTHSKDDKGVFSIEKSGFTCIALFGIKDILRQEVPEAVRQCKVAGIRVRMVTGDNKLTARAIARECGIIDPARESIVLEGIEFIERIGGVVCKKCRTKTCPCPRVKGEGEKNQDVREDTIANAEEFDRIIEKLDVLARSRPEDKYALVTGLKERNNVVAVTGDGTNDAPALKKADVGFAMGQAGTSVAKEAAAIILLDDNFSSIVIAVMWGRNIYDSIKKFLQFQLTVNVVAVVITFIGAALLKREVLTPVQMLWVNLIMDTFASLALATEPPTPDLLLRKPHRKDEYILSKKMIKHILGQSIYQLIIMNILVFAGDTFLPEYQTSDKVVFSTVKGTYERDGESRLYGIVRSGRWEQISSAASDYKDLDLALGPSRHFTYIFNAFVMMQIFNFVNARKLNDEINILSKVTEAPLFMGILVLIFCLQILIIMVGGRAISCHVDGLTIEQWLICAAFGFGGTLWSTVLRMIPEQKICPEAGNKMTDPLQDKSVVMGMKRSHNEQKLQRKYSSITVPKPPSISRIAAHNSHA